MIKIIIVMTVLCFGYACGSRDNMEWKRPTKTMSQTWKEYYEKCLDENPSEKEKCDELKKNYQMEMESTQQMGIEPDSGQEPYY